MQNTKALEQEPRKRRLPLEQHPSVRAVRSRPRGATPGGLTLEQVRAIAREAGADDAGAVSLAHPLLETERAYVEKALAGTRTLVSLVARMHPDNVRSPRRSVANVEFHRAGHHLDEVAQRVAVALAAKGHKAINPAMAFPMELEDFPARGWVVSHKLVAEAAQLGRRGLHRNVLHPRFGAFVLLATVLTTAELTEAAPELDYAPCVDCKLCVAACPVGALEPDGAFRFSACYDHNYREFLSGFADVLEEVADARDREDLRERVSLGEAASLWQSLAYKPNYKAAHCVAVCPAGEEVLAPFLEDRAAFKREVLAPLVEREETVYVVAGSDAEAHVRRHFPHKRVRVVRSSLRPTSATALFRSLPLTFQRGPARGWRGTFHFDLSGPEPVQATVRIDDGALEVQQGLVGQPDVRVRCAGQLWLDVVTRKRNPLVAVLLGRLEVRGQRALLQRFAACFPR